MMLLRNPLSMARFGNARDEFDRLFSDLVSSAWRVDHPFPGLNVWEEGDAILVEAEVPGFKLDDLDISVANNELTIKGRRERRNENGERYLRRERSTGEFTRVLALPRDVQVDKTEATLKDGVLTLKLPKSPEAQPRKIAVKNA